MPAAPEAPSGLWARRWFRRTTYLIASGAVLAGLTIWAVQRPELDRWLIGKLDHYSREECGLGVQADRLEIHPFQGRILLHKLAVGGDLLQASLLEVDLEWASLLHTPHLRAVLLQDPVLNLDRARLARIKLKPHPPSQKPTLVRLDRLELRNGEAHVREPAWGLPRGDFQFHVDGRGRAANELRVQLRVPGISLAQGPGTVRGDLAVDAEVTEHKLEVSQGQLRLGDNRLGFKGGFQFQERKLNLEANGHLDLVQAQRLASPQQPAAASGLLDFQAKANGPLDGLAWSASLQGSGLQAKGVPLRPGRLQAALHGTFAEIQLEHLGWISPDAKLDASGSWTARAGYQLKANASAIPLAPVAGYTHAGFLKDLTASFSGEASLPAGPAKTPWALPSLDQVTLHGTGQFLQNGQKVGGLAVDLAKGQFQAPAVDLDLAELELHGEASGTLGPRGLQALQGDATVVTDAADVAGMLKAWDIGMTDDAGRRTPLDMSGHTRVQARCGWDPRGGLQLAGQLEVEGPRWHGARADQLKAAVSIDRDVLRVTDIVLDKGDGQGYGDFWLTWAKVAPGADQIDMCYQAYRLPVREGLRAADVGDLPLDGTGSGWVRLHGPFDRIMMEGQCVAEQGEAYGLHIPAASADFSMDIDGDRLRATDVRVADSVADLGSAAGAPTGPLALSGAMDMDTKHSTWQVALRGALDSRILGLQGPGIQGQVETHLEGPFTAPLGPIQVPTGTLTLTQGRVTQGDQTLEGLEGSASFHGGNLELNLGLAGKPVRLLSLEARQRGPKQLRGTVAIELGQDSADTVQLAPRITHDFLKDAHFRFHAQGDWTPAGLDWRGQLDRFTGQFEGFYLAQSHPGQMSGNAAGMHLALGLEGRTAGSGRGATPPATSIALQGQFPFSGTAPLALQLAGSCDLANLKTILDRVVQPGQYSLLADLHPAGSAHFDLNLGGTLQETTLGGTLTLKGGRAVAHSYPLSIEDLDFTAQFKGRDIIIPKSAPLRGTLAQGALTAWGQMTWRLGGISSYDVHSSLEDFQLRDIPDGFELLGSLDANLKGSDQDGGVLSGSIWAKRTLYHTEINLTDLILANALGPGNILSAVDPSDPLARIDLNLELHLAEPWDLDTNLLKLQGRPKGQFWIRGNLVKPGLQGRMELLPGGRLTNLFPAGDVVIERGTVEFPNPGVFNPSLNIGGEIDIPPYLVSLDISGPIDALQAKAFSTPSLRQDEIFAILIDPAAVSQVGGASSSTQTAMNTGLANTSSGLLTSLALANFQEQLRKTLNLDRVSVALRTGVGTPETTITLGKAVNLFGYHTPLVFTHDKTGEVTTISGQVEWRFGDFVFRLGASQSTANSLYPSGEIRHSWSPR
ncbi:MAG: translocation/assembly module TamB domain-containing protein [Holophaga sp.]|nr:translocation/assembly module TamB domain-containing protein [Holophaga sp.]